MIRVMADNQNLGDFGLVTISDISVFGDGNKLVSLDPSERRRVWWNGKNHFSTVYLLAINREELAAQLQQVIQEKMDLKMKLEMLLAGVD